MTGRWEAGKRYIQTPTSQESGLYCASHLSHFPTMKASMKRKQLSQIRFPTHFPTRSRSVWETHHKTVRAFPRRLSTVFTT
jgi:hypothetical protein